MENKLTTEEILDKTHSFMDDSLGRCYERIEVISAMEEYALQSQPPTVTDEEIQQIAENRYSKAYSIQSWSDREEYCRAVHNFSEGMKAMRNKLTPNK
jgi:hypothetical protein